jgi:hypothetical protein
MADLAQLLVVLGDDEIQHCVLAIAAAQVVDLGVWQSERVDERN